MNASVVWTPWRPLPHTRGVSATVLAETLDGGQSFRWHAHPDGVWQGTWSNHIARLRLGSAPPSGGPSSSANVSSAPIVEWSAPTFLAPATAPALARYLATDRDWSALADTLPHRSDAHLAACLNAFPGLRLLRQPFDETLLGFLCSATKQIVQIKQMLALLAERHGTEIFPGVNRLPTWPELAAIPESELRACLLGFRARYISATAKFLAAHPGWLEETEAAPYVVAKERLCLLPGVGEKVADCVLLFGAGRLEAFPVDVWILRTLATRYGLTGWGPAHVAQFGRAHFGPLAGLAQQYLFAYERAASRAKPPARAARE